MAGSEAVCCVTGVSRLLRQGELECSGNPSLRERRAVVAYSRLMGQSETGLEFRECTEIRGEWQESSYVADGSQVLV